MKQRCNNKKGISLIELMCSLVVVSLAVLFGLQLYFVGAKATRNSTLLDDANEAVVHYFESGDKTKLEAYNNTGVFTEVTTDVSFTLLFGTGKIDVTAPALVETVEQADIKTRMSILKGSIGNAAG